MVLEEPEHALLGHWLNLWIHARGGREEVPGHSHQGHLTSGMIYLINF